MISLLDEEQGKDLSPCSWSAQWQMWSQSKENIKGTQIRKEKNKTLYFQMKWLPVQKIPSNLQKTHRINE